MGHLYLHSFVRARLLRLFFVFLSISLSFYLSLVHVDLLYSVGLLVHVDYLYSVGLLCLSLSRMWIDCVPVGLFLSLSLLPLPCRRVFPVNELRWVSVWPPSAPGTSFVDWAICTLVGGRVACTFVVGRVICTFVGRVACTRIVCFVDSSFRWLMT